MKIASWIFTILSFLAAGVFVVMGVLHVTNDTLTDMIIIGAIAFVILGSIGHIIISKYRSGGGQGGLAVYIISFPAYLIPFIIIFVLIALLIVIDWIVYAFTQEHHVARFVGYLKATFIGSPRSSRSSGGSSSAYVVIDNGFERTLTFTENKLDHDSGRHYNRFRDETGKYWRSYDKNETFVKESLEQSQRGY